jgi:regulator of RNase E activity RraA
MRSCYLYPPVDLPDLSVITRLRRLPTPAVSDSMERTNGAPGILAVGEIAERLAGAVLTVKTRVGDNLVVHKALDVARPGEVLVIDAGGSVERAILGEIICRYAASRGIAGLVVNGAVRDAAGIRRLGYPVFAKGVSHLGPYKSGPGMIGSTVDLAGTPVSAGDLVVGDSDGIAVIPRDRAEEVMSGAEAVVAKEHEMVAAIDSGTLDRSWVDNALKVERLS